MHPTLIARIAYAASSTHASCRTACPVREWFDLEVWQRQALIHQVETIVGYPELDLAGLHALFVAQKAADGWVPGKTFSITKKRDPMLRPWAEIDAFNRDQDTIVVTLVRALSKGSTDVR